MFDKLIESDTAVSKPRRSYFLVSTVVVGILFLSAILISIYAQDLDLGVGEFEAAVLLAPVAPEAPEPPRPAEPQRAAQQLLAASLTHRRSNMLRIEEDPRTPTSIGVTPNTQIARPYGKFLITLGPESAGIGSQGASDRSGSGRLTGTASYDPAPAAIENEVDSTTPPPPARKEPKQAILRTTSVLNGKARSLPKPIYPPAAVAVGAGGDVNVQVTIDEDGNVIAAHAASGHPMLRHTAERAALNAKFTPTILNGQPVKVTGVIVYRFTRN